MHDAIPFVRKKKYVFALTILYLRATYLRVLGNVNAVSKLFF